MKKLLLGAAALLAITAPGVAAAQTGGYLGTGYATLDEEGDPDKESVWGYGGGAVTHVGNWRLGVNGTALTMDHNDHDDSFDLFEAHAGYDFGDFVVGGFMGRFTRAGTDYDLLGIEGGFTHGRFGVAGSYTNGDSVDAFSGDVTNLTVEGSFAITENWSVGGGFSQSDFDFGVDGDSYWVGAHYALTNGIVIGGGYRASDIAAVETDGFNLTFAWRFGDQVQMLPGARELMYDAVAIQ